MLVFTTSQDFYEHVCNTFPMLAAEEQLLIAQQLFLEASIHGLGLSEESFSKKKTDWKHWWQNIKEDNVLAWLQHQRETIAGNR